MTGVEIKVGQLEARAAGQAEDIRRQRDNVASLFREDKENKAKLAALESAVFHIGDDVREIKDALRSLEGGQAALARRMAYGTGIFVAAMFAAQHFGVFK
ncbi:MAG: hypothetical protein LBV70_07280 [Candidatus Adiutrix sp.]|jgi:hypothetical protein|nr:hypothetical protein [Candidatus Adiutrix sp.]